MEDDDSSSSLNRTTPFSGEKVQRGVVTTTTTEDEDDDTSSQSNSNNEVILAGRPEPVSSANTTRDSLTENGDPDTGCSPTSTGLNSTTEDADVEDNSSPRSGERITTSSSSSSDGYNFEDKPHSQQSEKNSRQPEWPEREKAWSAANAALKYARPSSSIFPAMGRNLTACSPMSSSGIQYATSSSTPLSFSAVTPNPFSLLRSPPAGGSISHNVSSFFQAESNSRSVIGTTRNNVGGGFATEGKSILRPSTLLANQDGALTASTYSTIRNPFGNSSSNASVSSSSLFSNPFNSTVGSKQDEVGGGGGQAEAWGTSGADVEQDWTTPLPPQPVKSILRQSKLLVTNLAYPCTSSDNSEARHVPGNDVRQEVPQLQQSTLSTISSEATPASSAPEHVTSEDGKINSTAAPPPTLFQSVSSSRASTFAQPVSQSAGTTSANSADKNLTFVFGSNISDRVIGGSSSVKSPNDGGSLPNGVSSTSSFAGQSAVANSTTSEQQGDDDDRGFVDGQVHSSTEDGHFQGSSDSLLGRPTEACFASSSTAGERKRKFSDQIVTTGEESESNVLQISCRLFVFDGTTSAWIERGRGQLRLNDQGQEARAHRGGGAAEDDEALLPMQSRIIVRTKGSLRLMLNTNVWSGQKVEKPSEKSVRFTAMDDNGSVKVFVVQSTPNEADVLFRSLECRIRSLLSYEASHPNRPTITPTSPQVGQQQPPPGTSGLSPRTAAISTSSRNRHNVDSDDEDSDGDVAKYEGDDDDSPNKRKRLEVEGRKVGSGSENPSPSTTTVDEESVSITAEGQEVCDGGAMVEQSLRSNVVPSIQVDKPEGRSDDEEDED